MTGFIAEGAYDSGGFSLRGDGGTSNSACQGDSGGSVPLMRQRRGMADRGHLQ
jgi:hypothetical protein